MPRQEFEQMVEIIKAKTEVESSVVPTFTKAFRWII